MSDANIAAIAGGLLVIVQLVAVRILDYYFPKGRISRRAYRNTVDIDIDDDDDNGPREIEINPIDREDDLK